MRACLTLILALVTPVFAWAVDWSGKGVSIVGDSYSAYGYLHGSIHCHYPGKTGVQSESQMWWAQVINEFGGTIVSNRSCAGSAIIGTYGVCPSLLSMAQNGQLGDPDVILVMGGLNDFWVCEEPWGVTETSFGAAVDKLFDCFDTEYGRAEKIVILNKLHAREPYRWGIAPMYRKVLREKARYRGYTLIDLDGYIGTEDGDFDTPETPHPTLQGMNKIAQRIISELKHGPGGYQKLYDYLETDSRGYLITDYVPNLANTKVEIDVRFFDRYYADNPLFYASGYVNAGTVPGSGGDSLSGDSPSAGNTLSLVQRGGAFYYMNSMDGGATNLGPDFGAALPYVAEPITLVTSGSSLTVDESVISKARTPEAVEASGPLVLFAERKGGHAAYSGMCPRRIYSIRIKEGKKVVRDLYPALSKDGVATLYDRITDQCLPVSGGGVFHVVNFEGDYVNYELCKGYATLQAAYREARVGDTVYVKAHPTSRQSVVGRAGVALDCGGYDNVEMKPESTYYKVVRKGDVFTVTDNDEIRPAILCDAEHPLFKPVDGKFKVYLDNVLSGMSYAVFTATDPRGPWTMVGSDYELERREFEVPVPPEGTQAFFIKACMKVQQ